MKWNLKRNKISIIPAIGNKNFCKSENIEIPNLGNIKTVISNIIIKVNSSRRFLNLGTFCIFFFFFTNSSLNNQIKNKIPKVIINNLII